MAQFSGTITIKLFVMANNLVETIQNNLGFPPLQKIDPNIQETKEKFSRSSEEKLAQAAIPAVLTALYNFSRSSNESQLILSGNEQDWLATIFEGKEASAVEKVAAYAGITDSEAESAMENVADEAVNTLRESAGPKGNAETIRTLMGDQRHHILVYLPAALQLGDLLNEDSLDDRTNKMEGPISNFMHSIESKFSGKDESKYP
jgi:hypothetical protein